MWSEQSVFLRRQSMRLKMAPSVLGFKDTTLVFVVAQYFQLWLTDVFNSVPVNSC